MTPNGDVLLRVNRRDRANGGDQSINRAYTLRNQYLLRIHRSSHRVEELETRFDLSIMRGMM